jgi:hypothetical protein
LLSETTMDSSLVVGSDLMAAAAAPSLLGAAIEAGSGTFGRRCKHGP